MHRSHGGQDPSPESLPPSDPPLNDGSAQPGAHRLSARLIDHALHPRNDDPLPGANACGTARFERCGDRMRLELRIEGGLLQDARCLTVGCGAALAAGSVATELLQGRTVAEARNLTAFELDHALGGVPAPKRHALLMVLECLAGALGPRIPPPAPGDEGRRP